MNRKAFWALFLTILLCLGLCGCGKDEKKEDEAEMEVILNVVVFDEKTESLSYEAVGPKGQTKLTEVFELDPLSVLNADHGCFQSNMANGKVVNTVVSIAVFDEETGEQVVPDPVVVEIFNQTAAIHDQPILALDILICNGRYFPVVDLDADDKAPVLLYYFNTDTNTMTELCRFDSVVIGGLQIPDPTKLP